MIFNRGNTLLRQPIFINGKMLKMLKLLDILALLYRRKNYPFSPTLEDLNLKANRAIHALNNKIKLSMLLTSFALKLFKAQIAPILLWFRSMGALHGIRL